MANSILGQQLTSNLSPEGTGQNVQPTVASQGASTLHKQSSDKNNPALPYTCLLYTSPSPRDRQKSRMPSSA